MLFGARLRLVPSEASPGCHPALLCISRLGRRPRVDFAAGAATGRRSSHREEGEWVCFFGSVCGLSSGRTRNLARIVLQPHDPGCDTGLRPGTVRRRSEGVSGRDLAARHPCDEFWAERSGKGAEPVSKRVGLTTGSHQFQCYWMTSGPNRPLKQLPFCWQTAEERWVDFFVLVLVAPYLAASGKLDISWSDHCIRCHTVGSRTGPPGEDERDTHVAEFGIACEKPVMARRGSTLRRIGIRTGTI